MSKRKLVLSLIALLILGSFGAYFFVKQRSGADIVEAETGTLSGTVTEVETGLPIAGAELELHLPVSVRGRTPDIPIELTTNENGGFAKEDLPPAEDYWIKVALAPGFNDEYLVDAELFFKIEKESETDILTQLSNTPEYQSKNKSVVTVNKLKFSASEIGESYFSYRLRRNGIAAASNDEQEPEDAQPSGFFIDLEDKDYFRQEKSERERILNELATDYPEEAEAVRKIETENGWIVPEEGTTIFMVDPKIIDLLLKRNESDSAGETRSRGENCSAEELAAVQQIAQKNNQERLTFIAKINQRLKNATSTAAGRQKYAWLQTWDPYHHWKSFMEMAPDPLWRPSKILDKRVWLEKEKQLLYNIYWPEWKHLYNRPTFTEAEKLEIVSTINFMALIDWSWEILDPSICEDIWTPLNALMLGTGALPRAITLGDAAKIQITRSGEKWLLRRVNSQVFQRIISAGTKGIEIIWIEGVGLGIIHITRSTVLGRINFIAKKTFKHSLLDILEQSRAVKSTVNAWEAMATHRIFGKYFPKEMFKDDGYYPNRLRFFNWSVGSNALLSNPRKKKGSIAMDFNSFATRDRIVINDLESKITVGTKNLEHVITHETLHDLEYRYYDRQLFKYTPSIVKKGSEYSPIDEAMTDFFARRISQINDQGLKKLGMGYQAEVENIAQPIFRHYLKQHNNNADLALENMVSDYYEKKGILGFLTERAHLSVNASESIIANINNLVMKNKYKEVKQLIENFQ